MTALRPATPADFPFLHGIAGRPENARFIIDEEDAGLRTHIEAADRQLLIWEHQGKPAGFALFAELDNPANRTELRRLALDRPDQGLGRAFLSDLIDYAFAELGVDRLWLDVAGDNTRAQRAYERAGFTYEGTLRAHWKRPAGDISDLKLFSILRKEWTGRR